MFGKIDPMLKEKVHLVLFWKDLQSKSSFSDADATNSQTILALLNSSMKNESPKQSVEQLTSLIGFLEKIQLKNKSGTEQDKADLEKISILLYGMLEAKVAPPPKYSSYSLSFGG